MKLQAKPIYHLNPRIVTPEISQALESIQKKWLAYHSPDSSIILYHYTTLEGLKGILTNRSIWCSHMRSFNDPLEFQYGKSLVVQELNNVLKNQQEREIKLFIQGLVRDIGTFEVLYHAYAACFCESDNLLSQWRGYSSSGGGYNIGITFENETMFCHDYENIEGKSHVILRKIIYDEKEQKDLINDVIKELVEGALRGLTGFRKRGGIPDAWASMASMQAVNILYDIVFSLKNPAFKEEAEWRLIKTRKTNHKPYLVNFRERDGILIPYLNTYIFTPEKDDLRFPLRTIRFGPMLDVIGTKPFLELLVHKVASMNNKITIQAYSVGILKPGYSLR